MLEFVLCSFPRWRFCESTTCPSHLHRKLKHRAPPRLLRRLILTLPSTHASLISLPSTAQDRYKKLTMLALASGSLAFNAPTTAFSRISSSRVARASSIEMAKKSVGDLSDADLKGKVVLVRCDLNVPLDGKTITDDTRIRASVPTVKYLMEKGAKVLLS